jgi:drug/metabolite transporter (DMT)-like permease
MVSLDLRTAVLTFLALLAFASNSLLTRLALGAHQIDAATFTAIRLIAGAMVLAAIVAVRTRSLASLGWGGALGPLALFTYAAPFTFAYVRIGSAAGALVLFGTVQLTMLGYGIFRGERPSAATWLGIVLAIVGFGVLTIPSAGRPDPFGLALMVVAGISWAVYSLVGRTTVDPLAANARSFLWSSPLALVLAALVFARALPATQVANGSGIALAVTSGAVTSGLGYAIWYRALPRLSVTQAAVAQLSVPVIAAMGASLLLQEVLSVRFLIAGATILSGVGLVLSARFRASR